MIRKIVQIDEQKCDGCGQCIPSCAEGAIALVAGKARLSSDVLCDGLGACLGECPRGAITVVEREAAPFDEAAVASHVGQATPPRPPAPAPRARLAIVGADRVGHGPGQGGHHGGGCPGSRPQTLPRRGLAVVSDPPSANAPRPPTAGSQLGQWPVQLHLVPPTAPYFQDADLLVAADCVPFAYARFHDDFLAGRAVVVGCPKLDDNAFYAQKLGNLLAASSVKSVTVVRMEVPCCGGISMAARQGLAASGKDLPFRDVVVGIDGAIR